MGNSLKSTNSVVCLSEESYRNLVWKFIKDPSGVNTRTLIFSNYPTPSKEKREKIFWDTIYSMSFFRRKLYLYKCKKYNELSRKRMIEKLKVLPREKLEKLKEENFSQNVKKEIDSLLDDEFRKDREEDWRYFCKEIQGIKIRDEKEIQRQLHLENRTLVEEDLDAEDDPFFEAISCPQNISKEDLKLDILTTILQEEDYSFLVRGQIYPFSESLNQYQTPIVFELKVITFCSDSNSSVIKSFLDFVFKSLDRFFVSSIEFLV